MGRRTKGIGSVVILVLSRAASAQVCGDPLENLECRNEFGQLDPLCKRDWALDHVGANRAFREHADIKAQPGKGILVAQIDTGIRKPQGTWHPEIPDTSLLLFDRDGQRLPVMFYRDCNSRANCGARDDRARKEPIDSGTGGFPGFVAQPGHGTGTASVLISPQGSETPGLTKGVTGIAWAAHVTPYVETGGVILTRGRSMQLSRAIFAVASQDRLPNGGAAAPRMADVISISAGVRWPDRELEQAVRVAEHNGLIVVAAAGQGPLITSNVRFPAQFPSVIAATGTTIDAKPWVARDVRDLFTFQPSAGRGDANAIAAPAVEVWRADWRKQDDGMCPTVGRGRGTSFATPLVAGAAALWLQRYGRAALETHYGRSAIASAFRYWLTQYGHRGYGEMCDLARAEHAHDPEAFSNADEMCLRAQQTWDETYWGKGILAVDKLLQLDTDPHTWPTAEAVCEDVYRKRGESDWNMVCPIGSPGRTPLVTAELLRQPPFIRGPARTSSISAVTLLGHPFGREPLFDPALSYGLIFSDHRLQEPHGLMIQAEAGRRAVRASIGYAVGIGYSPFGHSRYYDTGRIPGFGYTLGAAVKASYMRSDGADWLGPELEIGFYRLRGFVGHFWATGADRPRARRWVSGFGFGF